MKTNKETVEAMYQAFGQGNIPFILGTVSEEFTWTDPSNPAIVPQGGTFVGKSGFLDFFEKLSEKVETTLFAVDNYLAEGNTVVASGRHGVRIKTSGQDYTTNWIMIWDFENGKPIKGRSVFDTNQYEALFV
ncbi:nuclear transport factor 2 family protein [Emticicia sp. BO119]|uniref:nuclear transport factor 2 family protein n=1 Tax=Emticicia sp. BO119 TaxID=2757768 RepID=UPI0015F0A8CF|nr:nuclear transport factor 2 family protein [Emticicia sp. BO119]MBA4854022.1 nuclear transport factor 2 family protein [Emticicia sp. BO119]